MKQVKAVIFDWAGTLIDFGCMAPVEVFVKVFKESGLEISIEEAREPMGLAKRDHIIALLAMKNVKNQWENLHGETVTNEQIDNLYAQLEPALSQIVADYTEPNPFVVETLHQLREMGIKVGSTTGYVKSMMNEIVPIAAKKGIVLDQIVDSSDCEAGRPAPFMIQKNMLHFGITNPIEVVKVGDTVADIKEGINAGVWTVGVISSGNEIGLNKEEFNQLDALEKEKKFARAKRNLLDAGAHFVIDDMSFLKSIIEEINLRLLTLN